MRRPLPVLALTLLAASALTLSACNRAKTQTTTTTTTTAAAPGTIAPNGDIALGGQPAATAAAPGAPAPMPPDPCPSIGTLAETHGGAIGLNGPKTLRLAAVCSPAEMTAHLRNFGPGTRFVLVADDLRAGVQPGALFELRFGPPTGSEAAVLGTLNFFAANRPASAGQPHSVSYNVTDQIQALTVSGWPSQGLGVAIAPSGPVTPGSNATVGAVRLVAVAPR